VKQPFEGGSVVIRARRHAHRSSADAARRLRGVVPPFSVVVFGRRRFGGVWAVADRSECDQAGRQG